MFATATRPEQGPRQN